MGYSSNPEILERELPNLTELAAGHSCAWHTSEDRAVTDRLAYRLRQALYIASLHPEDYPELAKAHQHFTISVIRPGLIEAKPKETAHVETKKLDPFPTATFGGAPHGKPVSTVGKTTAAELIASWVAHLPSNDAINFQRTSLPESELLTLYNWAEANIPRLMILAGNGFITLALVDAGAQAIAWTPAAPTPEPEKDYGI